MVAKMITKFKIVIILMLITGWIWPAVILAQSTTTSNKVITSVGNPIGSSPFVEPSNLRQTLIDKFNITMNGFSNQQLQWAWEKFWDVSHTKLINLVKGTTITAVSGELSRQTGCKTVEFGTRAQSDVSFKTVLVHELGHIIYWCNPIELTNRRDHQNTLAEEGGLTGYSQNPCYGSSSVTEDYAETIAYYLNPGVVEQVPCNNRGRIPFSEGKFQKHYNVARSILGEY